MAARHRPRSLLVACMLAASTYGLRNVTINDNNSRVRYLPDKILPELECKNRAGNPVCEGNWWTEHRITDIHDTFGPNVSLEFNFTGSAFYFFAVTLNLGALGLFSMDNGEPDKVTFSSPNQGPNPGVFLWSKTDLDGRRNHTFRLVYDNTSFGGPGNRQWLGVDYFMYTVADDSRDSGDPEPTTASSTVPINTSFTSQSSAPLGSSPPSDATSPTSQPGDEGGSSDSPNGESQARSSELNTGSAVGIAAGVTCAVVFLLALPATLWFLHYRRTRPTPVQSIGLTPASQPPAAYAFTTAGHGSSSSTDGYVPVPVMARAGGDARFYPPDQPRHYAGYVSTVSSPGLPVDERPPPSAPAMHTVPQARASRQLVFQLHNPDASSHGTASHVGH